MENFFGTLKSVFLSEGVQECQCAKKSRRGLYPLLQQRADKPEIKGLSPVEYRTQALRAA